MISSEEAERPAWICESDAETIWMSRIAMNIPNTMKMNAASRFAPKWGSATPAGAEGRAGATGAPCSGSAAASLTAWRSC